MQKINGPKSTTGTETASRRNIKGKAIRSLNLAREMIQRREDFWSLCSGLLEKTDQSSSMEKAKLMESLLNTKTSSGKVN